MLITIAAVAVTVVPAVPVAADTTAESKLVNVAASLTGGTGALRGSASPNGTAPDLQLRVPSRLAQEVPADSSFSWLGPTGEMRWSTVSLLDYDQTQDVAALRLSTRSVRPTTLATEDPNLHFSMPNVVAPGSFALYGLPESRQDGATGPDAPTELFRWGTGEQRDGSPQGLDATYALPAREIFNTGASFGASGMYCFDLGFTATLADGTPAGAVGTIRIAVGDTVAVDAPCGTATGEVPGEAPGPDPEPDPEPSPDPEPDPEVRVISDGHIDAIAPEVDTDESGAQSLALRAHHDTLGWLDWDRFVLHSDDTARLTLPATFTPANDWTFVGEPGQTIWNSPYSQVPGLPWVGMSTQSPTLRASTADDASVSVRIDAVTGPGGTQAPGHLALDTGRAHNYGSEKNGAGLLANTKNGLPAGYLLPVGTHVHYSWFFDQPGVYCIAITVGAELADGTLHTAAEQLTHVVGETVDPATVQPCGTTADYPAVDGRPSTLPAEPVDGPVLVEGSFWDVSLDLDGSALRADLLRSSSYRDALPERLELEDAIFRGSLADDGAYWFGHDGGKFSYRSRDEVPYLRWNTLGVPQDEVTGDVTWTIDRVDGPGDLWVEQEKPRRTVFDTAAGVTTASVWPQTDTSNTSWAVTRPGKYCVETTWSVPTQEHGTVSTTRTLTIVADGDGDGFEHDAGTLTETCVDETPPDPDPSDPDPSDPDPSDPSPSDPSPSDPGPSDPSPSDPDPSDPDPSDPSPSDPSPSDPGPSDPSPSGSPTPGEPGGSDSQDPPEPDSGTPDAGPGGVLAATGADPLAAVVAAVFLLLVGSGLLVARRRWVAAVNGAPAEN
ncbi:surface-anchored protein [Promicromonospora umidemergens]|uniref:Surface-anchored protein n=1 Tax=Promicromonospora umidemergens TaxID=629679 RepID=A0ABP8WDH7_9MICO|nr:choice-of-anchor M domain-containing protein [Promicromonospora umidemergens]MCP2285952.1 surface-anchored protein [Promicromonospora umidemergens]